MIKVKIETSARHVHLTKETFKKLFGKDAILELDKELSQKGEFKSKSKVKLIGPKGKLKASILGPFRDKNQVEISLTDAVALGIKAPVRLSGDTDNTPGITLEGDKKKVTLDSGVIIAKRHIHISPEEAIQHGLEDKQTISVEVKNGDRSLVFNDVIVRVKKDATFVLHIDTDEANAAGTENSFGIIKKPN